jgi:hypothetical protein
MDYFNFDLAREVAASATGRRNSNLAPRPERFFARDSSDERKRR